MGVETLGSREQRRARNDFRVDRGDRTQRRPDCQKCEDREASGEARGAAGRQDVVRTDSVVAEDLGGARADEERTEAASLWRQCLGTRALEFQMLRSKRVGEIDRFLKR